jgi:hypothetical protein
MSLDVLWILLTAAVLALTLAVARLTRTVALALQRLDELGRFRAETPRQRSTFDVH